MSDKVFPITLTIEVEDVEVDADYFSERIALYAHVGGKRLRVTHANMTGYEAENNPSEVVRLLVKNLIEENQ